MSQVGYITYPHLRWVHTWPHFAHIYVRNRQISCTSLPCLGVRAHLPIHSFHRGWSRKGACGHPLLGAQQGCGALHNLLNLGPHSKLPSCPRGSTGTIWRLCSHTQNNSKASPHHGCRSIPTISTGTHPSWSHPTPQFLSYINSCSATQE